jgi:large subunit ribosomal protein L22
VKAYLKNYRQAPRKVRLIADMVRGKRVRDALDKLTFTQKKAAPQLKKLIESAVANARTQGVSNTDNLRIKEIRVDKGFTFVRYRPRFGGRATPINRESSHVTLTLSEK